MLIRIDRQPSGYRASLVDDILSESGSTRLEAIGALITTIAACNPRVVHIVNGDDCNSAYEPGLPAQL